MSKILSEPIPKRIGKALPMATRRKSMTDIATVIIANLSEYRIVVRAVAGTMLTDMWK